MPSNRLDGEGWEPWQALGGDTHLGVGWGRRTRLIKGSLGCVSSSLGCLASIVVMMGGEHPEGAGTGQGWQKMYLSALGSDSFPAGLAGLQYFSQPVVCPMAQIAICANIGIYSKRIPVVFLLSFNLFCTKEAGDVKDSYNTQSGPRGPG